MLFPYTYVPHKMEKMQEFIDFIFYEVWCKAPIGLVFHPDLFNGNPDLKEVMKEFGYSSQASKSGKLFYKHVKSIYKLFGSLSPLQINLFKLWFEGNNELEKVCFNDPLVEVARYEDISIMHKDLSDQLGSFFKSLYSPSLLSSAILRKKISDIDDHYQTFIETNKLGKCPFCGVNDLLGQYHSKREAYDHYLPKAIYPFNSINFKNLVPACHQCNSSYKGSKDPAYTPKDPTRSTLIRRKIFYPFTTTPYTIEVKVVLKNSDIAQLKPEDVDVTFGPSSLKEPLDTWNEIYGIDERYKAKLCSESDGKAWLEQVLDEWKELGRSPSDYLQSIALHAQKRPYTESNFLKKPFLEACSTLGLFNNSNPP